MDLSGTSIKLGGTEHDRSETSITDDGTLHEFEIDTNLPQDLVLCGAVSKHDHEVTPSDCVKEHLEVDNEHILPLSDAAKHCTTLNTDYCLEDDLHPIDSSQELIAP